MCTQYGYCLFENLNSLKYEQAVNGFSEFPMISYQNIIIILHKFYSVWFHGGFSFNLFLIQYWVYAYIIYYNDVNFKYPVAEYNSHICTNKEKQLY